MIKIAINTILFTFLAGSFLFAATHLMSDPNYCDCTLQVRTNPVTGATETKCGGDCTTGLCGQTFFDLDWDYCNCPDDDEAEVCNCFGLLGSEPGNLGQINCQTLAGQCKAGKTCYPRAVGGAWANACECR